MKVKLHVWNESTALVTCLHHASADGISALWLVLDVMETSMPLPEASRWLMGPQELLQEGSGETSVGWTVIRP
jgi:hypothetical protein